MGVRGVEHVLFASFASDRLGRVLGKHMPNYSGLRVGTYFREETPKRGCSVHKRVEAVKKTNRGRIPIEGDAESEWHSSNPIA